MQPRALLPFLLLALGVTAIPAHIKRDDAPNFVNDDGSIDFSALTAAAAIVPTIVAPAQASNVIIPVDTSAISDDVVSQAADQADGTPSSKRNLIAKRASTPAWAGYNVCGAQTLFTQAKVISSPDTPDAFRAETSFAETAKTAAKPSGYTLNYVALTGVYQSPSANSFLGSTTLTSAQGYNPQYCATYCDTKVKGCLGFNLYYERDPPINLDAKALDLTQCNNPPSVTTIACQFYGSPVNAAYATSTGQVRGNYFRTAKAGSNGYSKATYVPPTVSGFQAPQIFANGKIDNQKVVGKIAGTHVLTVNPDFNPQYCADVANQYYDGKYSSFETFMLNKNGAYVGQGCIVLTQGGYTSSDANDAGQFGGKSDTYDETNIWYSSQPVYYYDAVPNTPVTSTITETATTTAATVTVTSTVNAYASCLATPAPAKKRDSSSSSSNGIFGQHDQPLDKRAATTSTVLTTTTTTSTVTPTSTVVTTALPTETAIGTRQTSGSKYYYSAALTIQKGMIDLGDGGLGFVTQRDGWTTVGDTTNTGRWSNYQAQLPNHVDLATGYLHSPSDRAAITNCQSYLTCTLGTDNSLSCKDEKTGVLDTFYSCPRESDGVLVVYLYTATAPPPTAANCVKRTDMRWR